MSRNGSGTYTLPTGNPVVTNTVISSTWANSTLTDIASALTASVAADGQTPMTGPLNLNTNKIANLADPTLDQDGATKIYVDGVFSGLGTMANQNANSVAITGGTITGLSSALPVASGGTGIASLTTGYIPYGNGTSAFNNSSNLFFDSSKLGIGTATPDGQLTVVTAQTANAANKIKIQGYGVGYELLNASQSQNWYTGIAEADSNALYIGKGYGVGQGITPSIKIDTSGNAYVGGTTANASSNPIYALNTARAWTSFNGTNGSRYAQFNVSSVTRNSTGDYTVNFSSALSDSSYVAVVTAGNGNGTGYSAVGSFNAAPSSSSYRFGVVSLSGTTQPLADVSYVSVAFFR